MTKLSSAYSWPAYALRWHTSSALCRFTHTLSCFSTFLLVTTALFTSSFRLLLVYLLILLQEEVEGSEWYVSSKRFREQGQWVGSYGFTYNKSSSSPPLRLRRFFWCVFCMKIVYTCIVCISFWFDVWDKFALLLLLQIYCRYYFDYSSFQWLVTEKL